MTENYEFGPFSVDPVERLIWCRGNRVTLKGKPFDVLLHLLESGGHALAKEALMGRVWPDAIVEESNLTVAVSQLRRALRGADAQREYVETLPGRGYRFLAHGQPVRPRRGRTADSAEPVAFHAESGRAREARAPLVGRQVESATLVPGLEEAREGAYATLAEALVLAGRLDEALIALKTGFELVVEKNERWWEPELHRVRGELWLELLKHGKDAEGCDVGTSSAHDPEGCFLHALDMARTLGALSLELRAATSLARFWRDTPRRGQGRQILVDVVESFAEAARLQLAERRERS